MAWKPLKNPATSVAELTELLQAAVKRRGNIISALPEKDGRFYLRRPLPRDRNPGPTKCISKVVEILCEGLGEPSSEHPLLVQFVDEANTDPRLVCHVYPVEPAEPEAVAEGEQ